METLVLLLLCLPATAVSGIDSNATVLTAAPGSNIIMPSCDAVSNGTTGTYLWSKVNGDGETSPVLSPGEARITVLYDHKLMIQGVAPGDEGLYQCTHAFHGGPDPGDSFSTRYRLLVTSGPENVSLSIEPATALSNGTLIVYRGSGVSFDCSGSSYPSQRLTLSFAGASSDEPLASNSGPGLSYRMENIQPGNQGLYSCTAHNNVSERTVHESKQLLVYYASDRHPECMWAPAEDPSHALFSCTWLGAYPTPMLRWGEDQGHVYVTELTDSLSLSMNRSLLSEGQTLRCTAQHLALASGKDKSCSLTLKPPYPKGEPLVTALEGTSVTLTCTEDASTPPANTTWRKSLRQDAVAPGSKYVLSEEGGVLKLTIHNVTKDDEDVFFCRSENPLGVRELEVVLTVKPPSTLTGPIIGIFIAALVVGLAVFAARALYSYRHCICLGGGFGQMEDDQRDVLSLVDSDDDDDHIFQDAVPRLPPLTNGSHMTLAQIHQIPLSDHEDVEPGDTSSQQQEDTAQTEQLVDRVTYIF